MINDGTTSYATRTDMDREARRARVERVLAAPPPAIFDVLADPAMHPVMDGSGTVVDAAASGPDRLELGSRFGMSMRWKAFPYPIRNTVVEFEEDRRIAWRHFAGHRWRWELEPVAGGTGGPSGGPGETRVVHTFDWSTSRWPWALELVGYPSTNLRGMQGTIERLDDLVTS